jgi:hypothetical protein
LGSRRLAAADAPRPAAGGPPRRAASLTGDEWAAKIVNRTVHGVVHIGWVPDGAGYRGQMAVLVKPNGRLGRAYMLAIAPFRHVIVYPTMLREFEAMWLSERA